ARNVLRMALGGPANPDLMQIDTSDLYGLRLADDSVKKIVSMPGRDQDPEWSPDGSHIVFASMMGKTGWADNSRLAIVPAEGGTPRSITDNFDEDPRLEVWHEDGVYFWAMQKTASQLFRVDPATGAIVRITRHDNLMLGSVSLSADGRHMAFSAPSSSTMGEIYVSEVRDFAPRKLTDMTAQTKDLILGKREVISW